MTHRALLRQFLIVFAASVLAAVVLVRTEFFSYLSYAIEKGRLRALSETMPSQELAARLNKPNRAVAEMVTPAVVNIETIREYTARDLIEKAMASGRLDSAERFGETHPWFEEKDGEAGEQKTYPAPGGLGSGFIFDAEKGFVLTNYHVISDADRIYAVLPDGRRYEARVVGADRESDLAVLAIEADRLHEVQMGDSDTVAVGDDVFALGNPFGLTGTFSRGIVSAVGRSVVSINNIAYQGFIQTDAVINPGNSGGPLVNRQGEVIGINTAIATDTGSYSGVGFAIPVRRAIQLIPRLIAGGRVVRGYLGIEPLDIRTVRDRANEAGWTEGDGVYIRSVVPDTPADLAGLRPGDILVAIEADRVADADDLRDRIALIAPETEIALRIWRDGEILTVKVTLAKRPPPT